MVVLVAILFYVLIYDGVSSIVKCIVLGSVLGFGVSAMMNACIDFGNVVLVCFIVLSIVVCLVFVMFVSV